MSNMARKVFISFLGYTNYGRCRYFKDDFISENLRYIQIATLDYLQKIEKWGENDVAYILLTKGAKEKNWVDDGHLDFNTKQVIRQPGLASCLQQKNYPFPIQTIEQLSDGKTEEELFEIFKTIFSVLQSGDVLYFDITHGFRSLPMLALVLVNYAKFLHHAEVRSITYGNYEAREKMGEDSEHRPIYEAPIINLLPLSQIQDWTFATADYLKNGNVEFFEELTNSYKRSIFLGKRIGEKSKAMELERFVKNLKAVIDDFQTCRGNNIMNSKHISILKENVKSIGETVIEPLNPVIKKIEEVFEHFGVEEKDVSFRNGFEAAKWCMEHNLYQQAATILQETVVSFFCGKYGLDINSDEERKQVNTAFAYVRLMNAPKTSEEDKLTIEESVKDSPTVAKLMKDPLLSSEKVIHAFDVLTTERNDINHNGMRKDPHAPQIIRRNIEKAFNSLQQLI